MNLNDFSSSIGLVSIDFQGDAISLGDVPTSLKTYLRTEAFPVSAPPSLRSATDYGGVKLFAYQEKWLCVALFRDIGKKDQFQRAVASACVLIFPSDLFDKGFRNLKALREFLSDVMVSGCDVSHLEALHSLYEEAILAESREGFVQLLRSLTIDLKLLSAAMGLIVAHKKLKICSSRQSVGLAYFDTLYSLVPFRCCQGVAWSSYASSLSDGAIAHEEVILHDCRLATAPPPERGWLQGMKSRLLKQETTPVEVGIELDTRRTSVPDSSNFRFKLANLLVSELAEDRLNLGVAFERRQKLFIQIMGNLVGDDMRVPDVKAIISRDMIASAGLSEPVATRLREFVHVGLA